MLICILFIPSNNMVLNVTPVPRWSTVLCIPLEKMHSCHVCDTAIHQGCGIGSCSSRAQLMGFCGNWHKERKVNQRTLTQSLNKMVDVLQMIFNNNNNNDNNNNNSAWKACTKTCILVVWCFPINLFNLQSPRRFIKGHFVIRKNIMISSTRE